jgi:hypothetical protein
VKLLFKKVYSQYGILGVCLVISIALHLAVLMGFGSWKLFRYYFPVDAQFEAVPFQKKMVKMRTVEHKVRLRKKPPPDARVIRRIAVNKLSKVSLPTVPKKEKLTRKFQVSKAFLEGGGGFGDYDDLGMDDVLFGRLKKLDNSFEGKIYRLDEGTPNLPKTWPRSRYVNTIYAKEFDIPYISFSNGFPVLNQDMRARRKGKNVFEWFAIQYKARFYVRNPGKYEFRLSSDDGACITIDGKDIVATPGIHPKVTRYGSCKLSEGVHRMKIEYFQGPRYHVCLQVYVKPPGETGFKVFNLNDYILPADVDVPKY